MGGRASFGTSSKLKARTLSSAHFCLRNQSTELSTDRDFPHFHSHSQRERSKEKATTTTTIDIYYLLGATRIIQGASLECRISLSNSRTSRDFLTSEIWGYRSNPYVNRVRQQRILSGHFRCPG